MVEFYINKQYYDSLKILRKIHNFDEKLYMEISKDLPELPEIINKIIDKNKNYG